jgi:hypothetical protein
LVNDQLSIEDSGKSEIFFLAPLVAERLSVVKPIVLVEEKENAIRLINIPLKLAKNKSPEASLMNTSGKYNNKF